jgi:hypothetical protein
MSKVLNAKMEVTDKFLEKVRRENYLAQDMSDDEIIENLERFMDDVNDEDRLMLLFDALDLFNY